MGILRFLTDFFESIFMSSSPEVKKKQALHKIDSELRNFQPVIYKSGMLQPNLAEIFRILYENSKILDDLLTATISGEDIHRKNRFEHQLILTGFTNSSQEKIEHLSFENRRQEVIDSNLPMAKVFENQKHTLEYLIKELNSQDFIKIDEIIAKLQQLTDICRFNYLTIIRNFDNDYVGINPSYTPSFQPCVPDGMLSAFQDLYYLTGQFRVSSAVARALCAIAQLNKGEALSEAEEKNITGCLKKISTVFTKILTPDVLKKLICLAKHDPDYVPQFATYKVNARQKFANYLQEQFISDEVRIKNDMKDRRISSELRKLFGEKPLENLEGYSADYNIVLQQSTSFSYNWVTPLQIIKTFLNDYFTEGIKTFVNDIVIEGFFNNPAQKSDFSAIVFSCCEASELVQKFEQSFGRGGNNDQALIDSYIQDSHKNAELVTKLETTVDNINEQAHQIVQTVSTNIFQLFKQLREIFIDAKKTTPDEIANIKVLMTSSRNRETAGLLEQQQEQWRVFLEIMKNYAIIGELEH